MPDPNSRLVYSTDGSGPDVRFRTGPARSPAARKPATQPPPADGVVRIQREKKGHGGKTVTVVTGLPGTASELDALLKDLKQHCGAGGTRDGAAIVIQGDHRARIEACLVARGYRVKVTGG